MKEDTQTTTSTQRPWKPVIPLLRHLIRDYGNLDPSVTEGQSDALKRLQTLAGQIPNFGRDAFQNIRDALNFNVNPQIRMMTDAYGNLRENIGGTASGSELDPYLTPGFSDALSTMTGDITDRVKGLYAGSGRDPSGAGSFAGTLGRGLTEGIAPILMQQFNQNKANQMNAASTLYGAGTNTASGVANLKQLPIMMGQAGLSMIPGATAAHLNPAMTSLQAANMAYGQPFQNLAQLLQPAIALGSMGQQGTQTTTSPQSTFGNIMGGLTGGTGILSSMGAFGSGGWLTPALSSIGSSAASFLPMLAMSDERVKEDVEEIGKLHSGEKVVRFRYAGEHGPGIRMGLLAQNIEKFTPRAVHNIGGVKAVDYRKATDRAAEMRRAA